MLFSRIEYYASPSGRRRDNSHNSHLANELVNALHMKREVCTYTHTYNTYETTYICG